MSFLLVLAMLVVSVAALLPVVGSADAKAGEFEKMGYQVLAAKNVGSDDTSIRIFFKISSLDYDRAGFVFSKTDSTPTIGESGCASTDVRKVYSSITTDTGTEEAGSGKYWVAVILTNIPHSYFDSPIYVRGFVDDGEVRYSNTKTLNVCKAYEHTHTVNNPSSGSATLLTAGTKVGTCSVCGLTGVTEYDAKALISPNVKKYKNEGGAGYENGQLDLNILVKNTLESGQHFYPDAENGDKGRDFYFEIDMLWNQSIENSANKEYRLCFWRDDSYNNFFLFTSQDNPSGEGESGPYCNFAGGFDYGGGCTDTVIVGPSAGADQAWDHYPNICSGSAVEDRDYGWHRIGVRVHQDAEPKDNETAGEAGVTYSGYVYLYIDGELRWQLGLNTTNLKKNNLLLFTCENDGEGNLTGWADVDGSVYFDFWANTLHTSPYEVDFVYKTPVFDAVKSDEFRTNVVPVASPAASTDYTLPNGNNTSTKVYFAEPDAYIFSSKDARGSYRSGDDFLISKSLREIQGDEHFWEDEKDLWVEYSLLVNESFENYITSKKEFNSEVKILSLKNPSTSKRNNIYLLYTRDNVPSNPGKYVTSGDCPYKYHFDFSTYKKGIGTACILDDGPLAGWDEPIQKSSSPDVEKFGWHRIGIRIHQGATNEGGTVVYDAYSELYIDGVKVWKILLRTDNTAESEGLGEYSNLLFTATSDGAGGLNYSDNAAGTLAQITFENVCLCSDPVYIGIDDVHFSIGSGFVHPVTKVADPAAASCTLPDGSTTSAKTYFNFN